MTTRHPEQPDQFDWIVPSARNHRADFAAAAAAIDAAAATLRPRELDDLRRSAAHAFSVMSSVEHLADNLNLRARRVTGLPPQCRRVLSEARAHLSEAARMLEHAAWFAAFTEPTPQVSAAVAAVRAAEHGGRNESPVSIADLAVLTSEVTSRAHQLTRDLISRAAGIGAGHDPVSLLHASRDDLEGAIDALELAAGLIRTHELRAVDSRAFRLERQRVENKATNPSAKAQIPPNSPSIQR